MSLLYIHPMPIKALRMQYNHHDVPSYNHFIPHKPIPIIFSSFFVGEIPTYPDIVDYKVKPSPYKNIKEITLYLLNRMETRDTDSILRFSLHKDIVFSEIVKEYEITRVFDYDVNVLINKKPYKFKFAKHDHCWMLLKIQKL